MFYQINQNWIINLLNICDIGKKTDPQGIPIISINWENGNSYIYTFDSVEIRDQTFEDIKDILVGSRKDFIE